jgi:hypothetical protein
MGNELSYVGETGHGCLIYRETSGRYVVSHAQQPLERRRVATLASAYATCHGLEMEQRLDGQRQPMEIGAAQAS